MQSAQKLTNSSPRYSQVMLLNWRMKSLVICYTTIIHCIKLYCSMDLVATGKIHSYVSLGCLWDMETFQQSHLRHWIPHNSPLLSCTVSSLIWWEMLILGSSNLLSNSNS